MHFGIEAGTNRLYTHFSIHFRHEGCALQAKQERCVAETPHPELAWSGARREATIVTIASNHVLLTLLTKTSLQVGLHGLEFRVGAGLKNSRSPTPTNQEGLDLKVSRASCYDL